MVGGWPPTDTTKIQLNPYLTAYLRSKKCSIAQDR